MRLLVDENLAGRELISRLERAGHELVPTPLGRPDEELWDVAQAARAVVLTINAHDFIPLAEATAEHAGLLLVHLDNNRARDMRVAEIAAAVERVIAEHGDSLIGHVIVLNRYRS